MSKQSYDKLKMLSAIMFMSSIHGQDRIQEKDFKPSNVPDEEEYENIQIKKGLKKVYY